MISIYMFCDLIGVRTSAEGHHSLSISFTSVIHFTLKLKISAQVLAGKMRLNQHEAQLKCISLLP